MSVFKAKIIWLSFAVGFGLAGCSQKSNPVGEAVKEPEAPSQETPLQESEDDEELFIILDEPRQ